MTRAGLLAAALGVVLIGLLGLAPQAVQAQEEAEIGQPETLPAVDTNGKVKPRDPTKGAVTNMPIPRYVSLKGGEGNARRGPGLTHRIDWVFTTAGMPLRVTAEHEHWRRVEDAEGMGGWVHYSLLSGVRSVLVTQDMAQFHDRADVNAPVAFQTELGVIGRLMECSLDWCRVNVQGEKGWVQKTALWGVDPGEIIE
jgi:SH3-like domain-containing protein